MDLNERKKQILRAVIDDYISTAEPVGSMMVVQNHNLGLSSATVRNEMADLEAMGYLEKPHTSAGRVPSEKGYRFYVDSLMEQYDMPTEEMADLEAEMELKMRHLGNLLAEASEVISDIMHYTTFITLKRMQSDENEFYVAGASNIFNHPEFNDLERARRFLAFIDRRENMRKMLESVGEEGINIRIGSETGEKEMSASSIVVANFGKDEIRGKVGIIGPTRMDYAHVVSSLRMINDRMARILFNIFYDK